MLLAQTDNSVRYASGWGTFRDSMRAPVHGWFAYPAGFSYKAVECGMDLHGIAPGMTVYDPFMGTGTTNLVAKSRGVNSFGAEAHPFVFGIAQAKLEWNVDEKKALKAADAALAFAGDARKSKPSRPINGEIPPLVTKCYEPNILSDLLYLRDGMRENSNGRTRQFLRAALTSVLRRVSSVQTGWPYIAPGKPRKPAPGVCALAAFSARVREMLADIRTAKFSAALEWENANHDIRNADARDTANFIGAESVDFIFTSPPYLNNYDYADRTRLEMYFFGDANNWRDMTVKVRDRLMISATTQVAGGRDGGKLSAELRGDCPRAWNFLSEAIERLSVARLSRGGKKDYHRMVRGYFNDMHRILRDAHRVLRPGSSAVFVLGDSAPYGVHIPTDELVGEIGKGVGFAGWETEVLRKRGDKWKNNPQRHGAALRESVVTLRKG